MIPYNKKEEYDAFGPWIQVVGERHALPPLFALHCPGADNARILVKIPREIDRGNANPDMHLYDSVVGVMDDYVLVLKRNGDDVTKEIVTITDIQAIQKTNDLLSGKLCLYTTQHVFTINYNTVSDDIISRIITIIRNIWPRKQISFPQPSLPYSTDTMGFLYVNLIRTMQNSNSNIRLLAFQPQLTFHMHSSWNFIAQLKRQCDLQCTAFLTDLHELITIHRSTFASHTKYAYSYTYVPLRSIIGAQIVPHPNTTIIRQFEYRTTGHTFKTTIGDGNSGIEDLCRTLTGLSPH